jgi:phenylpropionate dioxygenase-like ring-hydroxylating dioxygenase large terminal subunit
LSVRLDSQQLAIGTVLPVDVDGEEFVVWRGRDGRIRSGPRRCPHLDHDLADGYVVDDELVCAGHAWTFDGAGTAFKRNEFGRADPKGRVPVLAIAEDGDVIDLRAAS